MKDGTNSNFIIINIILFIFLAILVFSSIFTAGIMFGGVIEASNRRVQDFSIAPTIFATLYIILHFVENRNREVSQRYSAKWLYAGLVALVAMLALYFFMTHSFFLINIYTWLPPMVLLLATLLITVVISRRRIR